MLLLASTAIAATALGWPCGRLNWAWRNVWSTCSINSYLPASSPSSSATVVDNAPLFIRVYPTQAPMAPLTQMAPNTYNVAPTATGGIPVAYCQFAAATDGTTGANNYLRNRCRRAVDAYGQITSACSQQPNVLQTTMGGVMRGPIPGTTLDWVPQASHQPHVTNVGLLAAHYQWCYTSANPTGLYRSPASTCPGLLGWFYVVYNSCSFNTYGPAVATGGIGSILTPLGNVLTPQVTNTGAATPYVFNMCGGSTTLSPSVWLTAGPTFRTHRCRKALDQFGRTAYRCRYTPNVPSRIGPKDALITLYDGFDNTGTTVGAATQPMALVKLAPICN